MIDPARLLADLQRLLSRLEPDIRRRVQENNHIDADLRGQHEKAKAAGRTAQAYEVWRDDYITQVAVAWILNCVFIRFLEDNGLVETSWLSGPGQRLQLARDQHEVYFQQNPSHSDREYLEYVFAEIAKLPSMRELLRGDHNPATKLGPSGDGAQELREFWQLIDPSTGILLHDFTDSDWNTRFLGDLYQNLSEAAQKRFALRQTPHFLQEFILDRTLNPAIKEFGFARVLLIDPACGSGHFLISAFHRLLECRMIHEPGTPVRTLVQSVLDQISGIDVNPFAVAIARFRLLAAAVKACGILRLAESPGFSVSLATGDSLLHGPSPRGLMGIQRNLYSDPLQHYYDTEDADRVQALLSRKYHIVVGNPPYINVADSALREAYRSRFGTCYGKYQLVSPFIERFLHLCVKEDPDLRTPSGFVGIIVANAFMWASFGKPLIEKFFVAKDLTHIVDTSILDLPDHGTTPTVILFVRDRAPHGSTIRTIRGRRNRSPKTPSERNAEIWGQVLDLIDSRGGETAWITVSDTPRTSLAKWPWPMGGGGAAELTETIERASPQRIKDCASSVGITSFTLQDEVYALQQDTCVRLRLPMEQLKPVASGVQVRDWIWTGGQEYTIFPYNRDFEPLQSIADPALLHYLWPYRTCLGNNVMFSGKSKIDDGLKWYEFGRLTAHKLKTPLSIVFSEIATHNHFVLDRGGVVFNQTAPLIKFKEYSSIDRHLDALACLNSSVGGFWFRQKCKPKSGGTDWSNRFVYAASKAELFPLASASSSALELVRAIQELADSLADVLPGRSVPRALPSRESLDSDRQRFETILGSMISLQEELDWQYYAAYGLTSNPLTADTEMVPRIRIGERAFEIVMARRMAAGDLETSWFEKHRCAPITEIPKHWPAAYQDLVERRIAAIENNRDIGLIEQPEYKRRWSMDRWEDQIHAALRRWLLNRIEASEHWRNLELSSCSRLADVMRTDKEFCQVAELYRERPDFDWTVLITELVDAEAVPILAILRYTESGFRKRLIWTRTWDLQRREDAIEAEVLSDKTIDADIKHEAVRDRKEIEIGKIPTPPEYEKSDFVKEKYWTLRGKLDVPNERFVSFPYCERDVDPTPVIGWAGWDHLQLARAIAAYYERVKNQEGWTPERRMPLLAGILELLPWLKQWHNDMHPEFQERMGDFFEQFVQDEARAMEMAVEQIRAWTPPIQTSRGRRRRNS
jgi:hypothetical protein